MLAAWNGGDADALNPLMSLISPELRRIARRYLENQRSGRRLESTGLASEAYLKLARTGRSPLRKPGVYLALCAQIIRRLMNCCCRLERAWD